MVAGNEVIIQHWSGPVVLLTSFSGDLCALLVALSQIRIAASPLSVQGVAIGILSYLSRKPPKIPSSLLCVQMDTNAQDALLRVYARHNSRMVKRGYNIDTIKIKRS